MRFFDIFKKKDKKDTDIENSLNDYFHKLEKYKKLNKGEVGSIPDVDLKTAVMSWIRGKFNEDWTNQYEVIESLPKPCRHVYACCTVIDEVSNGGLNQLFFIQQDSLRMEYKLYFNPTEILTIIAPSSFLIGSNYELIVDKALQISIAGIFTEELKRLKIGVLQHMF